MESESIPRPGNSSGGGSSNRLLAAAVLGVFALLSAGLLIAPRFFGGGELSPEERVDATDALIRTAPVASQGKYTDAELTAFGKRIESLVRSGDGPGLRGEFDFDTLLDTALAGLDPQNAAVKKFRDQLRLTLRVEPVVDQMLGMQNSPDDARFVGVRSRDGGKVLLFRYGPFEGVPLHIDLLVDQRSEGLKVVDGYMYPNGQFISEVARTMAIPLMVAEDRGAVSDEATMGKVYQQIQATKPLIRLMEQGDFDRAISLLEQFPPELRSLKSTRSIHVNLAVATGDIAKYEQAISALRSDYPEDPALNYFEANFCVSQNNFLGLLKALDAIDQAVGGDPYLDFYRADTLTIVQEYDKSIAAIQRFLSLEPTCYRAQSTLLITYLFQKDDVGTLAALKKLDQMNDPGFDRSLSGDGWEKFKKSPQYQEWLAYVARQQSVSPTNEEADIPPPFGDSP